jgi:hypothetical protein
MDFEIQFNDLTLLEANGLYQDVCDIMRRPRKTGIVEDIVVEKWMIESAVTIQNPFGLAQFSCHFYYDGRLMLSDYVPTIKDIHNPDLRCLSYWAGQYGWNRPEPLVSLIDTWHDFWHHQWDTFIIDSEHFDHKFGERENRIFGEEDSEESSDDE